MLDLYKSFSLSLNCYFLSFASSGILPMTESLKGTMGGYRINSRFLSSSCDVIHPCGMRNHQLQVICWASRLSGIPAWSGFSPMTSFKYAGLNCFLFLYPLTPSWAGPVSLPSFFRHWTLQAHLLYVETSISHPIDCWSPLCTHRKISLSWRDLYRWWVATYCSFFFVLFWVLALPHM